jgi:hypothetical protein
MDVYLRVKHISSIKKIKSLERFTLGITAIKYSKYETPVITK